ncbi:unnamed protein product [Dovyalis caffra]|uniref:Uncharacterized protein n=1 Tax=Dovyalis caffra TaxID=77055 RepID=A0AAV1S6L2_9ROSI|nr:unnamed protein product [Dovyalis caffra]
MAPPQSAERVRYLYFELSVYVPAEKCKRLLYMELYYWSVQHAKEKEGQKILHVHINMLSVRKEPTSLSVETTCRYDLSKRQATRRGSSKGQAMVGLAQRKRRHYLLGRGVGSFLNCATYGSLEVEDDA